MWRIEGEITLGETLEIIGEDLLFTFNAAAQDEVREEQVPVALVKRDDGMVVSGNLQMEVDPRAQHNVMNVHILACRDMPTDMEYRCAETDGRYCDRQQWSGMTCKQHSPPIVYGESQEDLVRAQVLRGVMPTMWYGLFLYCIRNMPWRVMPALPVEAPNFVFWMRCLPTQIVLVCYLETLSDHKARRDIADTIANCTETRFRIKKHHAPKILDFATREFRFVPSEILRIDARTWDGSEIVVSGAAAPRECAHAVPRACAHAGAAPCECAHGDAAPRESAHPGPAPSGVVMGAPPAPDGPGSGKAEERENGHKDVVADDDTDARVSIAPRPVTIPRIPPPDAAAAAHPESPTPLVLLCVQYVSSERET
jgi:hypothetical protein